MRTHLSMALSVMLAAPNLFAEPRTSANYSVTPDTTDAGGARATSTSYTSDASLGGVVGIATVASPAQTAKSGYIGQLYEVTALNIAASPATVNEMETRQLSAALGLDDDSTITVAANDVSWSVLSGPIGSISSGGLATAGTVYEDTLASVQGSHAGVDGLLDLTVLDTIPDNFGSYGGDGIDDDWQFQHFGLNNPLAGPMQNPDFDPHNNLFEFTAGLIPTDPNSVFHLDPVPVPNQPGQMNLVISPRLPDRTYTVKWSPTLGPGAMWNALTSFSIHDDGLTRTITDLNATGTAKFYQIEITKP